MDIQFSAHTITGEGKGKELGFPTINLVKPDGVDFPDGVYIVSVTIDGVEYMGGMHSGIKKTLSPHIKSVEVHLLNYTSNQLPQEVLVSVKRFLRPVVRFESAEQLSAQITADIQAVKDYFNQ